MRRAGRLSAGPADKINFCIYFLYVIFTFTLSWKPLDSTAYLDKEKSVETIYGQACQLRLSLIVRSSSVGG